MTFERGRRHVRFLASVTSESEAMLAAAYGADIIDCKDPSQGALGALPVETVRSVRRAVPDSIPVSATIGDLPAEPEPVTAAVSRMAASGADYVKIGFFAGGDARATIARLGATDFPGVRLVGILLADQAPDLSLIEDMRLAGFVAVMLDTAGKGSGALRDHMSPGRLRAFVESARSAGLLAGLAGSLRVTDIAALLTLEPDILGFRGALCEGSRRDGTLDAGAVGAVRREIPTAHGTHPIAEHDLECSL